MLPCNMRILSLLHDLARAGLRFQVFGSTGLALHHPRLLDVYPLPDLDLLLPPEHDALRALVRALQDRDFRVSSWGEPWEDRWGPDELRGRFYLRATRDALTVDATYEATYQEDAWSPGELLLLGGVPVCSEGLLWRAKLLKDRDRAFRFAREHGLEMACFSGMVRGDLPKT
jgi:hypothetical protein